ncbi:MAG: cell division protein FtsA [Thermoanaerobacteraceae bacterium]|nr:cell division protein FtsA [Thermoanaerobacteraceae bacterium]
MARDNVIVGLDLGTSKVIVTVAEVDEYGQINLVGMGETASTGLRKGIIVDIDRTVRDIRAAVEKAERMSGVGISGVCVGIGGQHIQSLHSRGVVAVANAQKEISVEDVQRVLQASKVITLPSDRRIIHCLPRQYIVDGNDGIVDPVGMSGERLEVETGIVTGLATSIQNTLKSVELAGLEVVQLVLNPLASAYAVLQPAEKELGCVVIDIGGGTTEIAIFDAGSLWWASILPVGGHHITSDLAVGLRAPIEIAERIKIEHGCVLPDLLPDNEYVSVSGVGSQEEQQVSKKFIGSIIEPRVQEILALVRERIKSSGYQGMLPGGVIITGGVAGLSGLKQLASQELDLPVRIGQPQGVGGLSDMTKDTSYATAVGLIIYGAQQLSHQEAAASREPLLGGIWLKISDWFKEIFGF